MGPRAMLWTACRWAESAKDAAAFLFAKFVQCVPSRHRPAVGGQGRGIRFARNISTSTCPAVAGASPSSMPGYQTAWPLCFSFRSDWSTVFIYRTIASWLDRGAAAGIARSKLRARPAKTWRKRRLTEPQIQADDSGAVAGLTSQFARASSAICAGRHFRSAMVMSI